MELFDEHGRRVDLAAELGRGGEGTIYALRDAPERVAKIYHDPLTPQKVNKLAAMVRRRAADLARVTAWPTSLLHTRGGPPRGFTMPKIEGRRELHQLYGASDRRQFFPNADWGFLIHAAGNLATAVETVHDAGHVIGDVNESGVMVASDATVVLIDCDSFQIDDGGTRFRCTVGKPDYTPPELQGKPFDTLDRTPGHDTFGLAVLIFQLLFMGRHPFVGVPRGAEAMQSLHESIRDRRFPYSLTRSTGLDPPPHTLSLRSLPLDVGKMFDAAFKDAAPARPTARMWRVALHELIRELRACNEDSGHKYPRSLASCPWCAIEAAGGPLFFPLRGGSWDFDDGFDLLAVWRRIGTAATRAKSQLNLVVEAPVSTPQGAPLPEKADSSRLGTRPVSYQEPRLTLKLLPELPTLDLPQYVRDPPGLKPLPELPPEPHYEPMSPAPPPFEPQPMPQWIEWIDGFASTPIRLWTHPLIEWSIALASGAGIAVCLVFIIIGIAWQSVDTIFLSGLPFLILSIFAGTLAPGWWNRRRRRCEAHRARQRRGKACADVRAENDEREKEHERLVETQAQLQREVTQKNMSLEARWREDLAVATAERAEVAAANDALRAIWAESAPEREAPYREAWQRRVEEVRLERRRIEAVNAKKRSRFDALQHRHLERQREIAKHDRVRDAWVEVRAIRQDEVRIRRERLESLRSLLKEAKSERIRRIDDAVQRLKAVKEEYEALRAEHERSRSAAAASAVGTQKVAFLRSHTIRSTRIQGIGEARLATLAAYGIQTAADLDPTRLLSLPRFGTKLQNRLLRWRERVEQRFRFDPNAALPPDVARRLLLGVKPGRDALRRALLRGEEKVLTMIQPDPPHRQESSLSATLDRLTQAKRQLAQAEADLRVIEASPPP